MEGVLRWPVVADELKDLRTKLWMGFRKYQHNRDLFKFLWDRIKRIIISDWTQRTGRFIRPQLEVDLYLIRMRPCHLGVKSDVELCKADWSNQRYYLHRYYLGYPRPDGQWYWLWLDIVE